MRFIADGGFAGGGDDLGFVAVGKDVGEVVGYSAVATRKDLKSNLWMILERPPVC